MKRLVLDTNVLVSALLSPEGPPAGILSFFLNGHVVLLYDNRLIAEYRAVLLRPKFGFPAELVDHLLEYIRFRGEFVAAEPVADILPDPDDRKFLEVARGGRADFLVTGNSAHFPSGPPVTTPAGCLRRLVRDAEAGAGHNVR